MLPVVTHLHQPFIISTQNSAMIWEANVHIHEPVEHFTFQPQLSRAEPFHQRAHEYPVHLRLLQNSLASVQAMIITVQADPHTLHADSRLWHCLHGTLLLCVCKTLEL